MPITISHRLVTALLRPMAVTLCLSLAMTALTSLSHAQTLLPQRGMSQHAVEQAFGTPDETRPPVGQPPIERWVYADFTVYFEGDYALHAVSHHAPPPAAAPAATVHSSEATAAETTTRPAFRFDPSSGQITEVADEPAADTTGTDAVGEAGAIAMAAPIAAAPAAEPAPAPAPEATVAAGATEATGEADTHSELAIAAGAEEPAIEETAPRFRFDPVSGRIILDDAPLDAAVSPDQPQPSADSGDAGQPQSSADIDDVARQQEAAVGSEQQGGYRMQW